MLFHQAANRFQRKKASSSCGPTNHICYYGPSQNNEPGQIITAGIGMEIIGCTAEDVEQDVIEMAIENLVTQWNPEFDGEKVFPKRKKSYKLEGLDVIVNSIV